MVRKVDDDRPTWYQDIVIKWKVKTFVNDHWCWVLELLPHVRSVRPFGFFNEFTNASAEPGLVELEDFLHALYHEAPHQLFFTSYKIYTRLERITFIVKVLYDLKEQYGNPSSPDEKKFKAVEQLLSFIQEVLCKPEMTTIFDKPKKESQAAKAEEFTNTFKEEIRQVCEFLGFDVLNHVRSKKEAGAKKKKPKKDGPTPLKKREVEVLQKVVTPGTKYKRSLDSRRG